MKCPKCKSKNYVKHGVVKQKQRYLCKECNYHYTVRQRGKPEKLKRDALILYLEGLGFRSIGRVLNLSHVTIYNWIKSFGEQLEELRSDSNIEVIEMDEMHTYVGQKKTTAGYGLLLIEMGKGLSNVFLVQEIQKQERNFGKK